ncbi:hypothetical protein B0T19DRAFT_33719 [Cercophora scortea]|uniref:Uncharacterized protein n=1 Tax=Cercophora scortea TaxID=314031 RepID=A0AAE0MLL9_9PEZI|nr:hypothetical protein B0T19DRAFT_33719 [Cercophora scortea]
MRACLVPPGLGTAAYHILLVFCSGSEFAAVWHLPGGSGDDIRFSVNTAQRLFILFLNPDTKYNSPHSTSSDSIASERERERGNGKFYMVGMAGKPGKEGPARFSWLFSQVWNWKIVQIMDEWNTTDTPFFSYPICERFFFILFLFICPLWSRRGLSPCLGKEELALFPTSVPPCFRIYRVFHGV